MTLSQKLQLLGAFIVVVITCAWLLRPQPPLLEQIQRQGHLKVITRNAPTSYYIGRHGPTGFEHDLVQSFAEYLGVTAEFQQLDNTQDIINRIVNHKAHLAAAGLTKTPGRAELALFGPEYQKIKQQLICHREGPRPKELADLQDVNLLVADGTSYIENLQALQATTPQLHWTTTQNLSTEQLLREVWLQNIDCTVADSNIFAINQRYYPKLRVALDLSEPQALAWLLPKEATLLQNALNHWFEEIRNDGVLDNILQRHYAHAEIFDFVDLRAFKRRINSRLPKYQVLFVEAGEENNIDWSILAAQAYQESHWNPKAKSPTGVRGIMMLTQNTAKSLGVTNRLDPEQSIAGGTLYLRQIKNRLPNDIPEQDRLWFALAAYNIGMGHIYDARRLAKRLDKNPNLWIEMREVLPLLSQKQYYSTLRYGYARGTEPVRYVERIHNYHDILLQELKHSTND